MQLNPLVKKDIKVQSRSMRISWGLFAYEAVLAVVFCFAMIMIKQQNEWSFENIYSSIIRLYPILTISQFIIIGVTVPVRTASAISGEKERQTFDIMMTTSMTEFSIVWGKVLTAVIQSMFYVAAAMPVLAMVFVVGGLSLAYLFWFLVIAVIASLFAASIGIYSSSICKKSVSAVIMSYIFYLGFFILTAAPLWIEAMAEMYNTYSGRDVPVTMGFLLFNPAFYLIEFYGWIMGGESYVHEMFDMNGNALFSAGVTHYLWMAASSVILVLVSLFFLGLTARRITPVSKRAAKKLAANNNSAARYAAMIHTAANNPAANNPATNNPEMNNPANINTRENGNG